ncbi:ankyrin repeat domain-containing protein [Flavobacterium sp. WC2509]|uniref:ankyrin repeat domain-containing protein n=1 Tax=Flavobacterium sp. WC2509 TaxID=3461406 RepID=UPI0040451576
MKKSVLILGIALITTSNVVIASNVHTYSNASYEVGFNETITPLAKAVFKGDLQTVKKFIEYGANVNEYSNGMSPLMIAARYNKVEIITFLLSKGARKDEKDENGFTALKYAEISNAAEAILVLKKCSNKK